MAKGDKVDFSLNDDDIRMIMTVMMIAVVMSQMLAPLFQQSQVQAEALQVEAQKVHSEGRLDPRNVHATAKLQWIDLIHEPPRTPWVYAYIVNDGPYAVEIGINDPNDRQVIYPGGSVTLDRSGKLEGIAIVFYICPWDEAYVRITGEY